jgi:hypothetical protein
MRAHLSFSLLVALAILLVNGCESGSSVFQAGTGGHGGPNSSSAAGAGGVGGAGGPSAVTIGSGGASPGCAKVDFLFVIDNSVSMKDEQDALIASFPGFIDSIKANIAAKDDYHILVADTDDWGKCKIGQSACTSQSLCQEDNDYICNATFEACDMTIGAGVVHPAGKGASNQLCQLTGAKRYIQMGEPDINAAFACVAQLGLAGHAQERPMESMVAALSPAMNAADACNDGFLRSDALLVVTFITDEGGNDAGTPQDWYDAVVAAKSGDENAVVVIGFVAGGANSDLAKFIALWGKHGFKASVNDPDYSGPFASSISLIDEACDNFIPH